MQCCASVDYILLADIRDTRFARDPLALMAANAKRYDLYFNSDRMNDWMEQRFAEIQHPLPQYQVGQAGCTWAVPTLYSAGFCQLCWCDCVLLCPCWALPLPVCQDCKAPPWPECCLKPHSTLSPCACPHSLCWYRPHEVHASER